MRTKETKANDGGFTRLLVVKTVDFSFLSFFVVVARSRGLTYRGCEMCWKTQDHVKKYDYGNDDPVRKTGKKTQMCITDFWTQRERVG